MLFWNSLAFSMIQWMLAIWSLVPLPFLLCKFPQVIDQSGWILAVVFVSVKHLMFVSSRFLIYNGLSTTTPQFIVMWIIWGSIEYFFLQFSLTDIEYLWIFVFWGTVLSARSRTVSHMWSWPHAGNDNIWQCLSCSLSVLFSPNQIVQALHGSLLVLTSLHPNYLFTQKT